MALPAFGGLFGTSERIFELLFDPQRIVDDDLAAEEDHAELVAESPHLNRHGVSLGKPTHTSFEGNHVFRMAPVLRPAALEHLVELFM